MINYNKSWKSFSEGLEVTGAGLLFLGILFLPQLFTEDWPGPTILLVLGVVFLVAGIKVKKWAKKNGKK